MLMKLEHRSQAVAGWNRFLRRVAHYNLFTLALIFFSVVLGTIGYRVFGELTWLDSFHMACMILTGMGPVAEMTTVMAKLFSAFYALYSGIAFLSITAVFFAPLIHRLLHILHAEERDSGSN